MTRLLGRWPTPATCWRPWPPGPPRTFLALNGAADRILPIDGLHDAYAVARPAYDAAGSTERLS
jgi:hypothetical protein